jgi:hypothetical protein
VKLAPAERKKSTGIADLLAKDSNAPEPGLGLHDAAEKGLVGVIENIFDRTMDLNIDHRVSAGGDFMFCHAHTYRKQRERDNVCRGVV